MDSYTINFYQKLCLYEIDVKANNEKEAIEKAYKQINKLDFDLIDESSTEIINNDE